MLGKVIVHMSLVGILLQLRDLALGVESHQIHKLHVKDLVYHFTALALLSTYKLRSGGELKAKSFRNRVDMTSNSPYLLVAVAKLSTAAQGDSPPPMTRVTSTLTVSILRASLIQP